MKVLLVLSATLLVTRLRKMMVICDHCDVIVRMVFSSPERYVLILFDKIWIDLSSFWMRMISRS